MLDNWNLLPVFFINKVQFDNTLCAWLHFLTILPSSLPSNRKAASSTTTLLMNVAKGIRFLLIKYTNQSMRNRYARDRYSLLRLPLPFLLLVSFFFGFCFSSVVGGGWRLVVDSWRLHVDDCAVFVRTYPLIAQGRVTESIGSPSRTG